MRLSWRQILLGGVLWSALAAAGCGSDGPTRAAVNNDAGADTPGSTGNGIACLDLPDRLLMPPTGLPCDLLPPGLQL